MINEAQSILLVEDNHLDAHLFSSMLDDAGVIDKYNVTHSESAEDALEQDLENDFDVIFLDMNLPGVSGLDAVAKIHSKTTDIPIVILTGEEDQNLAANAIKIGCQDYLVKGENTPGMIRRAIRYAVDRKNFENKLLKLARYDSLTQIVKREVFYEQVDKALSLASRNDLNVAVMFVDLDNFKYINDKYGHIAGDRVLKEVAVRLKKCVRSHDTVARFGGDEFIILLEGMNSKINDCHTIAKRINRQISAPIKFGENNIVTGCSIGVSTFPECGATIDEIVNNADVALQLAKEDGKGNYRFYSKSLDQKISKKADLEIYLKESISSKKIDVHYQPIVNISTGEVEGVEALSRLLNHDASEVSPDKFISIAEKTGVIHELGSLVLEKVCDDYDRLMERAGKDFSISINVSPRQFEDKNFAKSFIKYLKSRNVSPKNISIEITENIFLDRTKAILESLKEVKKAGIKIYLDDFGTGYSSLGYLGKLPFDVLKIDRSFVGEIATSSASQLIARTIVSIAESLNLSVIAEGVEGKKQLNYLQSLGCDKIQGYYFSEPQQIDDLFVWMDKNSY